MRSFFLSLLFATALFAGSAKEAALGLGAENDYTAALKRAKAENKILVMVIVKENCRWCDKLLSRTFTEPEVQKELKNFVTLIVDRNDDFPNVFKENIFPSIFYIDSKSQKSIYENAGYVGKKCFLNDLKSVIKTRDEFYK